ncbi:uncharacterized protein LOC133180730 [Saccostrea echinata]|uniref:uncharacterized protein LOC133180730 n=1 Tax=Saccostrea echinata TaxID=191078 RepID=UPI002A7EF242|nr:uncharacterized protein LOC133180730 [Saccostrea echinata]
MNTQGFSTQCKVRQCFQCQGETEFYCNTCKYDLCLQCKNRHVIDLDTINHDVIVYREKYEYISKQETCLRHTDRIYEKYCYSCKLPLCAQCTEHRNHKILDIRTAYKTNRQEHREILHRIRSETLYNNHFLLAKVKTDVKTCHTETSNYQPKMSTKAQRLKNLIDTVVCDVKIKFKSFMIHRLQEKNRHLANIENYENSYEQSANRPVKFLLFLKKTNVPKILGTPHLMQNALLSLADEINIEDVIKLMSEIQIIESGKRQVRNEYLLKLMSTPVLHRSVKVKISVHVMHISCVNSDQIWISDKHNYITSFILMNTAGDILHHLTDTSIIDYKWTNIYGAHTVNSKGELIYIDWSDNIYKLSTDNRTQSTLVKGMDPWEPRCVYCSTFNGDLLVGMFSFDEKAGKVNRYISTGQHIQTIQHDNKGQQLYSNPRYIVENRNGDVIVSDITQVVVTDHGGRHRFSYTGPPSGSQLLPYGICTDGLSHILVCDTSTRTVQMIDKDGHFLSQIHTHQQGINTPHSLSYDNKAHLLWVGSWDDNTVCVYRYIQRKSCETGDEVAD